MKILKPNFWVKKVNLISIILFPITILLTTALIIKRKLSIPKKFKIPIICVGNIFVGGTGKTPLSLEIAKKIKDKKKAVIIRKFYKNHNDEHKLINQYANLILKNSRVKAVEQAIKQGFEVAILDDGFQDYSLEKDLSILCFNSKQLIGNGLTLPSGPLRENLSSIRRAQLVVINGSKNEKFEKKLKNVSTNIKIFYSNYIPVNLNEIKNKKILAFAGIGNPENFFDILKTNDVQLEKSLTFPDHYEFQISELKEIFEYAEKNELQTLTTEKDYHRIKHLGFKNLEYLKVELKIDKENEFINEISKIYD